MSPSASERRVVAILFAEAGGLAALAERAGPEAGVAMIDATFSKFRSAIEARGGTVDKFVGEGVMAVFGAPVAHGDDAARAVLAALALRGEAAALGSEVEFRAGVNAGDVLWAGVAGERPTAMGDAVNVAQRLQSAAPPGVILASVAVEALARRRVRFTPAGTFAVRGRVEPVEAFRAEAEAEPGTAGFLEASSPPVGRDAELARLRAALATGRGVFLAIEGEAGMGKTRFLAAAREEGEKRGWVGAGRALGGAPVPLAAMGEILRRAARRENAPAIVPWLTKTFAAAGSTPVEAENFAHFMALSIGLEVPDARVAGLDASRRGEEAVLCWKRWLRLLAAHGPVLLVIDDLDRADSDTVALLERFAADLADLPVAIVAALRPGVTAPAGFESLRLDGLSREAASSLAASSLGAPAEPALLEFIVERANGNPYAVVELARYLEDEHLVSGSPLRLTSPASGIPRGLQALLQARLDALGPEVKDTLKAASAIGRTFWSGPLDTLAGRPSAGALAVAERRGILDASPDSLLRGEAQYTFRDALLREAAYALLPKRDRPSLHDAAAEWLLARGDALGRTVYPLAAAQREAAGRPGDASELWMTAAEHANLTGLAAEALLHARESFRASPSPGGRMSLATALNATGSSREALEVLEPIFPGTELSADERNQLHIVRATALFSAGETATSVALARGVLERNPTPIHRLQALQGSSMALFMQGRLAEARADAILILELSASGPLDAEHRRLVRRSARIGIAQIALREHKFDECAQVLEEQLAEDPPLPGEPPNIRILLNRGNMRMALGDLAGAEKDFRLALEVGRRNGDRPNALAALMNLSTIYYERGDFRASLESDLQVLAYHRENGNSQMLGGALNNVGASYLLLGDFANAGTHLEQAVRAARASEVVNDVLLAQVYLGELRLAEGKPAEAERVLDEAITVAGKVGFTHIECAALAWRSRVKMAAGRAGAEADAMKALEVSVRVPDVRLVAMARATAARADAAAGRTKAALAGIASAQAVLESGGCCAERIRILVDLATICHAAGDAAGASAAAAEGLALAKTSSAAALAGRLQELLGRPPSAPRG